MRSYLNLVVVVESSCRKLSSVTVMLYCDCNSSITALNNSNTSLSPSKCTLNCLHKSTHLHDHVKRLLSKVALQTLVMLVSAMASNRLECNTKPTSNACSSNDCLQHNIPLELQIEVQPARAALSYNLIVMLMTILVVTRDIVSTQ
jgi:hypothetical protein